MRLTIHVAALLMLALLNVSARGQDQPQEETAPDHILVNGKILTADADFSVVQALAIAGERIRAVGSNQAIRGMAGEGTRVTDLQGGTVVPGLIDNHNHFVRATEQWHRHVRWDEVTSRRRALDMLRQKAEMLGEGEWVVVLGGWIVEQFEDDPSPFSRAELDRVLPDNPVYIQEGYSRGFANTPALEQAGVTAETAVDGGTVVANEGGELTGELRGSAAFNLVAEAVPPTSLDTWDASTRAAVRDYLAEGVTTLLDVGGFGVTPRHYDSVQRLSRAGELDMRVFFTLNANNAVGPSAEDITTALGFYPPTSRSDYFGQIAYGEMTYAPIRDPSGGSWNPGRAELDDYRRILATAAEHGWQVHEHSTRDDKMRAVLDMMAEVDEETDIAPLRWTLAHAEEASDATIRRARDLGVLFAVHSSTALGDVSRARRGEDTSRIPPIRRIAEIGARWGLGSDGTVVSGHHPFHNLAWAVTGIARNGEKLLDATVSREAALRAHTRSNAYMLFMEDELGSLEAGKYADLVVLDRDYLAVPPDEIKNIDAVMTMVGGKVVYEAE